MNIKKTVVTVLKYLFLAFFIAGMLVVLSGAKILSQRLAGKNFYRELIKV